MPPSPATASTLFHIRLSGGREEGGVLTPHEFKTKESEAHGLDSPGRRNSGKKTEMKRAEPGGLLGWGREKKQVGGAWLCLW